MKLIYIIILCLVPVVLGLCAYCMAYGIYRAKRSFIKFILRLRKGESNETKKG